MKYLVFTKQIFYFLIVGTIAVLLDYLVYIKSYETLGTIFSKLLGFYSGVLASFILNSLITFKAGNKKLITFDKFIKYFIGLTFSMILNVSINYILINLLINIDYSIFISFLCATFTSMCFNFAIMKFWIFK